MNPLVKLVLHECVCVKQPLSLDIKNGIPWVKAWTKEITRHLNMTIYPNLQVIIVAGHSAGSQMTQHYVALRLSTEDDNRLHFWIGTSLAKEQKEISPHHSIANPGSMGWCQISLPTQLQMLTLLNGKVSLKDTTDIQLVMPGDLKTTAMAILDVKQKGYQNVGPEYQVTWRPPCKSQTQGNTHLERGQYFVSMLEDMGGIPNCTTIDWVPGVGHDAEGMMASNVGVDKLFQYMGAENCA
ncbi:hypothetical protein ARMGADRAFT_1026176 [Armillaria gallica]|uniref:Alpha/beta-hydrolase n=1 Tax=Armillaria gallica TaxID=47427 RepID=A0A2H3DS48_ARMGA|nr:hypothetical protein ARMGADRAFT_1026176 [Armillaria gallica]